VQGAVQNDTSPQLFFYITGMPAQREHDILQKALA
jgi:hypothetical protein